MPVTSLLAWSSVCLSGCWGSVGDKLGLQDSHLGWGFLVMRAGGTYTLISSMLLLMSVRCVERDSLRAVKARSKLPERAGKREKRGGGRKSSRQQLDKFWLCCWSIEHITLTFYQGSKKKPIKWRRRMKKGSDLSELVSFLCFSSTQGSSVERMCSSSTCPPSRIPNSSSLPLFTSSTSGRVTTSGRHVSEGLATSSLCLLLLGLSFTELWEMWLSHLSRRAPGKRGT